MGELYKVIQWVVANAPVANVAMARFSLRAGEDVSKITAATAGDAAKIAKYKEIAAGIVGKPYA